MLSSALFIWSTFVAFSLSRLLPTYGFQRSNSWSRNLNSRNEELLLHAKSTAPASSPATKKKTAKQKQGAAQPSSSLPSKSTHRSTAVFALMESMQSKNFFAIRKLENDPGYLSLDKRDRSFARLLLTTTERRLGQIDKVNEYFMTKSIDPNKKTLSALERLCLATLRVGAAQLLFLDTPPYAVLKETVDVLRMHPKIKVPKAKISFVNAVLRSVNREGHSYLEKKTSIFDNCEPMLIKEWVKTYGKEKTTTIVEASMQQSPIFVSVNHRTGSIAKKYYNNNNNEEEAGASSSNDAKTIIIQKIADQFGDGDVEILPQGSIRAPRNFMGAVKSWPLYEEGDWFVQDPSATLPAIVLHSGLCKSGGSGDDDADVSTMHVVDLCSAPGGKTAQLCSMGFGKVSAVELSARRTKPLHENLKRLNMEQFCEVFVADGREWMPSGDGTKKIHGVLVDAPCSATGVGSRRPDVLRKSPDIDELLTMQRELAAHAADDLIEPGGMIVYATCSLLQQESEDQMKWLLSRSSDGGDDQGAAVLETVPLLPGEIPGFDDAIDENGWLRVLPGVLPDSLGFCDGFFVARLRKIR